MKKMNTLLAALTIAVMALTPVAAFADGAENPGENPGANSSSQNTPDNPDDQTPPEDDNPEGKEGFTGKDSMKVSVTRQGGYTVTIPDKDIDAFATGEKLTVKVNAVLEYGEAVAVKIHSENGWQLRDTKHEKENFISYGLLLNGEGNAIAQDAEILKVPYNTPGHKDSVTLVADEIATPEYAGTYSDTLTFVISTEGGSTGAGDTEV